MATRILLSEMVGALRKLLMVAQFLLYLKKITYLDVDHAMIEADIFTHFIINLISPSCSQLLSDTDTKNANQPFAYSTAVWWVYSLAMLCDAW